MKKDFVITPILVMLLLANLNSFAQKKKGKEQLVAPTFTMEAGKVIYSEVVTQDGESTKILYERCLGWFNSFYKNPTGVIKEKDVDQKIIGKGNFHLYIEDPKSGTKSRAGIMAYTIEVSVKEGRYKYDITRINKKAQSFYGIEKIITANEKEYKYAYASYLIQTDKNLKDLISNLKKVMATSTTKKKEDW